MNIEITQPHGYLRDSNGAVVQRFGNFETGTHSVPDVVDSVEYVSGPTAHTEPIARTYRRVTAYVDVIDDTVTNDGADTASFEITLTGEGNVTYPVTVDVLVQGDSVGSHNMTHNDTVTESLTSTASAGTIIEITTTPANDNVQSDMGEIEVVSA